MNLKHILNFLLILCAMTSCYTNAAIMDWRLTANTHQSQFGPIITVDYQIDDSTLWSYSGIYIFSANITFNGETSYGQSTSVINWDGLHALNVSLGPRKNDPIDFISFNDFTGGVMPTLQATLDGMSSDVKNHSTWNQVRFDYGSNSIYGDVITFERINVAEPGELFLLIPGLFLIFFTPIKYRRTKY